MSKNTEGGYVYLIGDWLKEGVYKIGVTRGEVEDRIRKLQTGNAGEIYIVKKYHTKYPFFLEKNLHNRLFGRKVKNEWFELCLENIVKFEDYCKEVELMAESLKDNPFAQKYLK